MRRFFKNTISMLLVFVLIVSLVPLQALAALRDTIGNTPQQNRTILEAISALGGENLTEAQMLSVLEQYGFLDSDGNFTVTEYLTLDGARMTLDEVLALINAPGADLSREVVVEGYPVTLQNLKTMVEIESKIAHLRELMTGGVTVTQEHRDNLAALMDQIKMSGIQVAGLEALGASGINHDARIKVTLSAATVAVSGSAQSVTATFTLTGKNGNALATGLPYPVSVSYRTVDGSAKTGSQYTAKSGVVTFAAGSTEAQTVSIPIAAQNTAAVSNSEARWSDDRVFFFQVFEPENCLLFDGMGSAGNSTRAAESAIRLTNNYSWTDVDDEYFHWNTDYANTGSGFPPSAALQDPNFFGLPASDLTQTIYITPSAQILLADRIASSVKLAYYIFFNLTAGYGPTATATWDARVVFGSAASTAEHTRRGSDLDLTEGSIYGDFDTWDPAYKLFDFPLSPAMTAHLVSNGNFRLNFAHKSVTPEEVAYLSRNIMVCASSRNLYLGAGTVGLREGFYDTQAPTVTSVTAPEGIFFYPGLTIPVTVQFSEPVLASSVSLKINDDSLPPLEAGTTKSSRLTFPYKVQPTDTASLSVTQITDATDINENSGGGNSNLDLILCKEMIISTRLVDAITGLSTDKASYNAGETVSIAVGLSSDDPYQTVLANDQTSITDPLDPTSKSFTAVVDGDTANPIPLTYEEESGKIVRLTGTYTPEYGTTAGSHTVELYMKEGTAEALPVIGLAAGFSTAAIIYAQSSDLTLIDPAVWPSGEENVIFLSDETQAQFSYTYQNTNGATAPAFRWESSNTAVAEVIPDTQNPKTARVTVKDVTADGEPFTVRVVATDGGTARQESAPITVKAGTRPTLTIPDSGRVITIRKGEDARVLWTTNVNYFNKEAGGESVYTVKLYSGELSQGDLAAAIPLESWSGEERGLTGNGVTSFTIPTSFLTEISTGKQPSYTVQVSVPNPNTPSETLTALAYVLVVSQPAIVRLSAPGALYLLDTAGTQQLNLRIEHFDQLNNAQFELRVTRVDDSGGQAAEVCVLDELSELSSEGGGVYTGSVPLSLADVTGTRRLKDLYTVTLRAKNAADSTWSSDSFVLHVYDAEALNILVDGARQGLLTLDNEAIIVSKNIGAGGSRLSRDEIQKLREDTVLRSIVSINYSDYAWSQLSDLIQWSSSDSGVVTVNYRQGALYEDINHFSYTAYLSGTQFALSGLSDGSAQVTATHAATGMTRTLTVDVKTLKDKLYVFQFVPMQETTLTYETTKGVMRTISTNSEGALALYEPDGIKGDIYLASGSAETTLYLGTLYKKNLLSGERDSTKLQLYPLNALKLREAARADLYFKDEQGSPYRGEVTFRGGVYKNGYYCQAAGLRLSGSTSENILTPGTQDHTVTANSDGRVTVYMDASQFWSEEAGETSETRLFSSDSFRYIFEVRLENDTYYPQLLFMSGNLNSDEVIRGGDSVSTLERVPADGKNKPFIAAQNMDYRLTSARLSSVKTHTGLIGPSADYPKTTLITSYMLWGQAVNAQLDYTARMSDSFGIVPTGQESRCFAYPFSTIPLAEHKLPLNSDGIWLAAGEQRGLVSQLYSGETMIQSRTMSFKVANMNQKESLADNSEMEAALLTLTASSAISSGTGVSVGNNPLIASGINSLIGSEKSGGIFKMLISPTEDPSVFKAMLWAGIGEMEFETNPAGIAVEASGPKVDKSAVPSVTDMVKMAQKKYMAGADKDLAENLKNIGNKVSGGLDLNVEFTGFYEAQIQYNFSEKCWEIYNLGGGFSAGVGAEYTWNYNTFVGPVPVTASLKLGGNINFSFSAAVRYAEAAGLPWSSEVTGPMVNDYLTRLRANAYVKAFAGVGFDLSVIALKIGIFGKIDLTFQASFLSRTYLANAGQRQINGQYLGVNGEVGIEFVAKFLFVSYEAVLCSVGFGAATHFNAWDYTEKYWDDPNSVNGPYVKTLGALMLAAAAEDFKMESSPPRLESRDYLNDFDYSWRPAEGTLRLLSLDPVSGMSELETNAYPYANPMLTDDGTLLVYLADAGSADVTKTEVRHTKLTGDSYPNGTAIDDGSALESYGDSNVRLAGTGSFAAAVWVRQSLGIDKAAGEELTSADIMLMSQSSEIMASIWDGAQWTTTRLTQNAGSDLAPVVAVNGSQVFVAWRSVSAAGGMEPINFTREEILYSIWDGTGWSEAQTLYNGTSGGVAGIEAAMLSDATVAVAYVLDKNETASATAEYYEIVYTVVSAAGELVKDVRLTNDTFLDENPQITAVKFGTDERFVLGWHSLQRANGVEISDIRLASFDSMGEPVASFPDSISAVSGMSGIDISGSFRFVRMAPSLNSIENLSILWSQGIPQTEVKEDAGVDRDVLKAIRFIPFGSSGGVGISAAIDVAEMPASTLLGHFDAYVSSPGGAEIKAALLGNTYMDIDLSDSSTYRIYNSDGRDIYVAKSIAKLYTATETYENKAILEGVVIDYANLMRNAPLSIQFTVRNAGFRPIDNVSIDIGGTPYSFSNLALLPNESCTFTTTPLIGATVADLDYNLCAVFDGSDQSTITGTALLTYSDIGISSVKVLSEQDGERVLQVTLYNDSANPLAGSGKQVVLGIYDNTDYETTLAAVSGGGMLVISDDADLALIDAGAYTTQMTFDAEAYLGADTELPKGGLWLYLYTWIEEFNGTQFDRVMEYDTVNNATHARADNLAVRRDESVTLKVDQETQGGATTATITLQNNRLTQRTSGNLIVMLCAQDGSLLEAQQTYDPAALNSGLIALGGEGLVQRSFTFGGAGASVEALYTDLILTEPDDSVALSSLSVQGTTVQLSDFVYSGDGDVWLYGSGAVSRAAGQALVTAVTLHPEATVEVNGVAAPAGSASVAISSWATTINIVITSKDGTKTATYRVQINSGSAPSPGDRDSYTPVSPNIDVKTAGDTTTVRLTVPATTAAGTATGAPENSEVRQAVEAGLNKAKEMGSSRLALEILLTGADSADTLQATLPVAGLKTLLDAANRTPPIITSLTFSTPGGSVSFDKAALAGALDAADGSTITIVIKRMTAEALTAAQRAKTGARPVWAVAVYSAAKQLEGFGGSLAVRLPYTPVAGETAKYITVWHLAEGGLFTPIACHYDADAKEVAFTVEHLSLFAVGYLPFDDVKSTDWFYENAAFAYTNGLMNGVGDSRFDPTGVVTRAMAVTILWRMEGEPEAPASAFTDLAAGSWYKKAVDWAVQQGIVNGVGNNRFAPDQAITREQMAAVIYRYAGWKQYNPASGADLSAFTDAPLISEWAREAMAWANAAELINGVGDNRLNPVGSAKRSEIAAILQRFILNITL